MFDNINPAVYAAAFLVSMVAMLLIIGNQIGNKKYEDKVRDQEQRSRLADIQRTIEKLNDIDIELIAKSLEGRGYTIVPSDQTQYVAEPNPSSRSPLLLVLGFLIVIVSAIINRPQ